MTTTVEFSKDHYHLQGEMETWCGQHISKNPPYSNWVYSKPTDWEGMGNWCMTSAFGSTFFYFRNESDAIMFTLKWK
jgi:hypothetical protein